MSECYRAIGRKIDGENMSEELKPCPFCKGQPWVDKQECTCEACCVCEGGHSHLPEHIDKPAFYLSCSGKCNLIFTTTFESEEEALKFWNVRASAWIPVSERLPEKDGLYLVTAQLQEWIGQEPPIVFINSFLDGQFRVKLHETTAWQPLPEPYEPNVITS